MASISLHRVGELVRSTFEILWNRPEGLLAREILTFIPEIVKLTEYEMGLSPSTNTPRYEKIVRLATIPLVEVGWLLKNDKGRWFITDEGRQACKRFSNVQELYAEALRLSEEGKLTAPESLMSLELIQEKAWENIEKFIQERSTVEIRRLFSDLLEAMQYHIIWVAPPEKSRGHVDLVASVDPIGARSRRILVQIKNKGQVVTTEGLKSFTSILGPNDFGLLLSIGGFTSEVRDEFNNGGYQKINFINLEKFFDLWIKHYDQLSQDARKRLPLKAIHFIAPWQYRFDL